jgi:hypothetical protein
LPQAATTLIGRDSLWPRVAAQHDRLQPVHLVRTECERALRPHLHAGPAVLVVACCYHRDRGRIECELREIGNGRRHHADVDHVATRAHETQRKRLLDRQRIGTVIVTRHDLGRDAHLMEQRSEPQTQCFHAEQIEFAAEQPARVIFAKPVRRDERLGFVFIGVRLQIAARLHFDSLER